MRHHVKLKCFVVRELMSEGEVRCEGLPWELHIDLVRAGGRVFASRQPDNDPIVHLHFTFWFRSVMADLGVSVLVGTMSC